MGEAILAFVSLIIIAIYIFVPSYDYRFKLARIGCLKLGLARDGKHTCSYLNAAVFLDAEVVAYCNRKNCPMLKGDV